MQAKLWTISGLATELCKDRKALVKALEGLHPDESTTDAAGRITRSYKMIRVVQHLYADADTDFSDQRQRLAAAQSEKVEHENAIRRGLVADVPAVERQWQNAIANSRAYFLGIGSKLGPRLVNIADASIIAAAIRAECRAALTELVQYDPAGDADSGGDPESVEAVGAPAGVNGQRVGGHRKKAQSRKQRGTGPVEDG